MCKYIYLFIYINEFPSLWLLCAATLSSPDKGLVLLINLAIKQPQPQVHTCEGNTAQCSSIQLINAAQ